MFDSVLFNILAAFLLLTLVFHLKYLFIKRGFSKSWIPITPTAFLWFSLAGLSLTAVIVGMIGPECALAALDYGFGFVLGLLNPIVSVGFFMANYFLRIWEASKENVFMSVLPRTLAGICICSLVLDMLVRRSKGIFWNLPCALYVAFVAWLFISSVLSGSAEKGFGEIVTSFLPTTVLGLLVLNSVRDFLDLECLTVSVALSASGIVAGSIYLTLSGSSLAEIPGRLSGTGSMGNPNDLASLIVLVLPFVLGNLFRSEAGKNGGVQKILMGRIVGVCCLGILLTGLWLSQSRGAFMALGGMAIAYSFIHGKSSIKKILYTVILLMLPLTLFLSIGRDESEQEDSSESRMNYAVTGFKMLKSSPIWGVGYGNYPRLYDSYTSLFLEEGERTAHSSWVLVMSETGLVGLGIFGALFASVIRRAWLVREQEPSFFLSMVGYGIAMSFLSHSYLVYIYILYSLTLSCHAVSTANLRGTEHQEAGMVFTRGT